MAACPTSTATVDADIAATPARRAATQPQIKSLTPGFFAILVGIFVIVLILRSVRYTAPPTLAAMTVPAQWVTTGTR